MLFPKSWGDRCKLHPSLLLVANLDKYGFNVSGGNKNRKLLEGRILQSRDVPSQWSTSAFGSRSYDNFEIIELILQEIIYKEYIALVLMMVTSGLPSDLVPLKIFLFNQFPPTAVALPSGFLAQLCITENWKPTIFSFDFWVQSTAGWLCLEHLMPHTFSLISQSNNYDVFFQICQVNSIVNSRGVSKLWTV